MRQSVFYLILAIGLGLLFVLVILPRAVNVLFSFIEDSSPIANQDTLPPQVPIIAAPATATTEETLMLSGYGEPESTVFVVVNGEKVAETTVAADGTFTQEVQLSDGSNTLKAYAVDKAGNESQVSHQYTVTRDATAPDLEIAEPQEGQSFRLATNQTITVAGTTEPRARVTVNGRLTLADSEGKFSTTYYLQEGETELTITSTDEAGNTTEKKVTVTFSLQ